MYNVTYAECHTQALYAECRYAECQYAECCGAALVLLSYNVDLPLVPRRTQEDLVLFSSYKLVTCNLPIGCKLKNDV